MYEDINVLVEVIRVLYDARSLANVDLQTQKYTSNYRNEMARVSGTPHATTTPPQGHNDVALGIQLTIMQPCDSLVGLDHLLERNVALQQVLRFVAMIHGATYAAVSGFLNIVHDGPKLVLLTRDLVANAIDPEMQIYDVAGSNWDQHVVIHQLTPPAWDSWTKIELAAKSIHRSDDDDGPRGKMLDLSEAFLSLYQCYMDYFARTEDSEKIRLEGKLGELVHTESPEVRKEPQFLTYKETIAVLQKVS